ncbi:MAG: hypothetical protein QGI64_03680 [Desulfobacterales bacterium]|nr:hypothetical protein [Desulfobacterales bacterium]
MALDDGLSAGCFVLGVSYLWKKQCEQAIAETQRGIHRKREDQKQNLDPLQKLAHQSQMPLEFVLPTVTGQKDNRPRMDNSG